MNIWLTLIGILVMALMAIVVWKVNLKPVATAWHPPRVKSFKRQWRAQLVKPTMLRRLWTWVPGVQYRPQVEFANIGEGTYGTGIKSYYGDATTASRYLIYKRGTDADHCAICGAGDDPIGSSDDMVGDTSIPISLQIFGAVRGTVRVTTDGTLADGDYCKAGATGKVTKATTGDLAFGRAMITTDTSSADGDVIGMIPVLPSKLSF